MLMEFITLRFTKETASTFKNVANMSFVYVDGGDEGTESIRSAEIELCGESMEVQLGDSILLSRDYPPIAYNVMRPLSHD